MRLRSALLLLVVSTTACGGTGCLIGLPESPAWRFETEADGTRYRVVTRDRQVTWYRLDGKIHKVLLDTNADGKHDLWAWHEGEPKPKRIDIDLDFDGQPDRFEELDAAGGLRRVGVSTGGKGRRFQTPGPDGLPTLVEHDEDGDGRFERIERIHRGAPASIEIDSDRNGRIDRWQHFEGRRLTSEELDTDGDGKPDRRLRYDARGELEGVEPVR